MDDAVAAGWAFLVTAVILLPVFLLARMKGGPEQRRPARRRSGEAYLDFVARSRLEGNGSNSAALVLSACALSGVVLLLLGYSR